MRTARLFCAAAAFAVACPPLAAAPPEIRAFNGGWEAESFAISPEGMVAAGDTRLVSAGPIFAFRWTRTGGLNLLTDAAGDPVPGAVRGASAGGEWLVGGRFDSGEAFRWRNGDAVYMGFLPGTSRSEAMAVTPDGATIVGWSSVPITNSQQAWRWTAPTGMLPLPVPPGFNLLGSVASSVSHDGSYAAGWGHDGTARRGLWWTPSGVQAIPLDGELGDTFTSGISADGQVVVGQARSPRGEREAFRWSAGDGTQWLGDLISSNFLSRAFAVSADGSVVVGRAGNGEAFIWDELKGMRSLKSELEDMGLDLTGWSLSTASGISADGLTITGTGSAPGFAASVGFVVTIPAPGAAAAPVLLAALAGRRRRR